MEQMGETILQQKLKKIIMENIGNINLTEDICLESNLIDIGINSITFIKIIVAIENEFEFEFSDEELDYRKFSTFGSIVSYVELACNGIK